MGGVLELQGAETTQYLLYRDDCASDRSRLDSTGEHRCGVGLTKDCPLLRTLGSVEFSKQRREVHGTY